MEASFGVCGKIRSTLDHSVESYRATCSMLVLFVFSRRHIVKEKGFPLIESLMFEDHDMIRRAAAECMCNMVLCDEVTEICTETELPPQV